MWLIGSAPEYMNMLSQINELHEQGKEVSKRARLELPPTAWQNSSMRSLQKLRGFVSAFQGFTPLDMNVAISDEEPFHDFVRNNRGSFPAEFSMQVQREMHQNERHPFHHVCTIQNLDNYMSSSGRFKFPSRVLKRGWVVEMNSFIDAAFPCYNVVPNGRDAMVSTCMPTFENL